MTERWSRALALGLLSLFVAGKNADHASDRRRTIPRFHCERQSPAGGIRLCETTQSAPENQMCPDRVRYLLGEKMNLNTVTPSDLVLLPAIGPRTTEIIEEARRQGSRFKTWEEVEAIPRLSPEARRSLREWTVIE